MKISKGFATWAGTVGALATFLLAVSVFMDTFDQLDPLAGLGPLAAAAGVLWKVIDGRMKQATALASNRTPIQRLAQQAAAMGMVTSTSGASNVSWGTASRAATSKPGEFDREPPTPPEAELRDLHDGDIT